MSQRYVIVGASSGIGKVLHDRIASAGHEVAAMSRSSDPAVDRPPGADHIDQPSMSTHRSPAALLVANGAFS